MSYRQAMQRLLSVLAARRERTVFPARVRLVAAPGFEAGLTAVGWKVEWTGASVVEAIAGLSGAALWEHARGGLAVSIIDGSELADGAAMPALITAARLAAPCVLAVVAPDAAQRALLSAAGWRWGDGQEVEAPLAVTISALGFDRAWLPPRRGSWAPLRLLALRGWAARPAGDPLAELAELAEQEPRLLLAHAQAPWRDLPPSPALLVALAVAGGEGRRVCWHIPGSLDLWAWGAVLRQLAHRGRALTLVVDDLADWSLAFSAALVGWWIVTPADEGEFRAVLARALGSDDLLLVVRPTATGVSPWPAGTAHEAGSGRWLVREPDARATLVCSGAPLGEVLRAQQALAAAGVPIAVYHVTSIQPLPESELCAAATRGPLVVADVDDPAFGLSGAIARLGLAVVPVGNGPLAGDLAAAVRTAL